MPNENPAAPIVLPFGAATEAPVPPAPAAPDVAATQLAPPIQLLQDSATPQRATPQHGASPTRTANAGGVRAVSTRRAALLTVGSTGLSAIISLVNALLTARFVGATRAFDAYLIAQLMPQLLGITFGPRLSAFLVPWLISLRHAKGTATARVMQLRLLVLCPAVTAILLLLCYKWNQQVVALLAPGFTAANQEVVIHMMRFTFPGGVCFMALSILTSIAYSQQRFIGMALATIINPAVTCILLIFFGRQHGVVALAAGFLGGPLLGCFPVLWSLRGSWQEYPSRSRVFGATGFAVAPAAPALREVPRFDSILALAVVTTMQVQIPSIVGRIVLSGMGNGVISAVEYASRISWMPVTVLANSVGNALLPSLAEKHQTSQGGLDAEALSSTTKAIRVLAYLLVPLAIVLACYAFPIISIALGGGKFDQKAAILTANMITYCTPLIWIGPIWMILFKVIQARNALNVLLQTLILGTVVDVLLMLCLKHTLGYRAIPLAGSSDCLVATAFALYRTRSSIALPLGEIMTSMAILTGISLCAVGVVFLARPYTPWLITGAVYGVSYLGLAQLLKIREQQEFWSLVVGRGLKKFRAAAG